ncbi:MAG: c-type cytochrome [Gemmatimonadota bacterium]
MRRSGIVVVVMVGVFAGGDLSSASGQEAHPGQATYDRWCAGCHGDEGGGDGPGATTMLPRPRDFTTGLYQIRTTPSGALPTDADILRVIDEGMPGTAMPGWRDQLSQERREALVDYLKTFSGFFEDGESPEPIEIGSPPGAGDEAIAEGREIYQKIECWKCHGQAGRGDGQSAPTLEDQAGLPIRAVDLTESWNFNGGSSVEAIYTRLRTGLDATPMPSFSDLIDAEVVTEEQLWRVAQYVKSLSPETPRVREVVRAALTEEDLPTTPDDERWAEVERFYLPLVGQVIEEPRWFAPSVDGVWMQALHDGSDLAVLVTWHDPSRSPDPDWEEWKTKMEAAMSPPSAAAAEAGAPEATAEAAETDEATEAGDTEAGGPGGAADGAPAPQEGSAPPADTAGTPAPGGQPRGGQIRLGDPDDSLVLQFPPTIPEGMERPYFLMGSTSDPVYLWVWSSGQEGAREAVGRGLAELQPLPGEPVLTARAEFAEGAWRLLIRRPLRADEVEGRLQIEPGRAIPMAVFAWDGSNTESGKRGSISTWYFLYLDRPSGGGVYVWPVVATLLTVGLGLVLVTRAQRRTRDATDSRKD